MTTRTALALLVSLLAAAAAMAGPALDPATFVGDTWGRAAPAPLILDSRLILDGGLVPYDERVVVADAGALVAAVPFPIFFGRRNWQNRDWEDVDVRWDSWDQTWGQ